QGVPQVHSVRFRIKDPVRLVEKIVRKLKDPEREIRWSNYRDEITDLIGLRVLHLVKDEWKPIHEFITQQWSLAETACAYVRSGDRPERLQEYEDGDCVVEKHPKAYRSVHYLLECATPTKEEVIVELQVRTIFEEAWSEMHHRVDYPLANPEPIVGVYLDIFNQLTGNADAMASLLPALVEHLQKTAGESQALLEERDRAHEEAKELVGELEVSKEERGDHPHGDHRAELGGVVAGDLKNQKRQGDNLRPQGKRVSSLAEPDPSEIPVLE
ncbi:MAG: RelA/SpoT domain-containing protein, partial [Chloroflexi bacterium]|nr:RelA/SpoT domain-containing protein [Chloroflexota bacterium]